MTSSRPIGPSGNPGMSEEIRPAVPRWLLVMLAAAAGVVLIYGIQAAREILVPFLLSFFIAVIGARPVRWLDARGLPHVVAVALVVGGIVGAMVLVSLFLGTSLTEFTARLPGYQRSLSESLTSIAASFGGRAPVRVEDLLEQVEPGSAMRWAAVVLDAVTDVFANAFLILITVLFILLEVASLRRKVRAIPGPAAAALGRFGRFAIDLQRYLNIKTVLCLATGLAVGLWVWAIGIDFPILWGLLAFLLNYVPTIGSFIAAIPAVMLAFIQYGLGRALITAAGYVAINVVIGVLLEPRIMGRGFGLSTLVVFLSLLFWAWLLGPVGAILSVPLTMTIKFALEGSSQTRWIALLLGRPKGPSRLEAGSGSS